LNNSQTLRRQSYIINKKVNIFLFYFLGSLIFLPSITFSILQAEIFPWALLFTLLYIKKIDKGFVFIVLLFLLSVIYGLYISEGRSSSEAIRSLSAYMNSLLIFVFLMKADIRFVSKLYPIVKFLFYFLVILGLLQLSGLIGFLDPVFKLLIPRGSAESLASLGNRGVTLLSSEPSRAAYEFLFIYAAFRTIFLNKKNILYYDLFVIIFMLFVIKSGVGLFLTLIFFALAYKLRFLLLSLILIVIVFPFLNYMSGRAFSLLINIISSSSFESLYYMLLNASGFRLISIISSFLFGLFHPFGGGIGNWQESSIVALQLTGYSPDSIDYFRYAGGVWVPIRPTSYFFALVLDIGLIPAFIVFLYLLKVSKFKLLSSFVGMLFIFYFLFIGAVGNPVPFVATALTLRYLMDLKRNNKT